MVIVLKNPAANAGDISNVPSIPRSGKSPGDGHSNSLQYSCLGNPMAEDPVGLHSIESQNDRTEVA